MILAKKSIVMTEKQSISADDKQKAKLDKGWVIANHILVSFHVAFISSVLSIPAVIAAKSDVLRYMFTSYETIASALFWYIAFHTGVSIHEMGHYIKAVRINALNDSLLPEAQEKLKSNFPGRMFWYISMFLRIPLGLFPGVDKTGLDYHPDAPYNLAVSAAGPATSLRLAVLVLPVAVLSLMFGLRGEVHILIYIGRLFLGIGIVGLFDFAFADPGKYKEFRERESLAAEKAKKVVESAEIETEKWADKVGAVRNQLIYTRMLQLTQPDGKEIAVPWEYRNCGMGGRHTEKEFPESNISLQESMFIPLSAKNYEEAQEMTVNLQTRLKEIIENAEGCSVKGIGTEGGVASYLMTEKQDILPVQRLWRMQKQAIVDCGYVPGSDVVIAMDPAASELQIAYRETTGLKDAKGIYLAWRDKEQKVLSRDDLLDIYRKSIEEDNLPIISIEDGFAEDDDEGWRLLMKTLGDRIIVIGDDNITTKDSSIERSADLGLINAALIKLNQIGTVTEGMLAMLTGIGKKLQLIVSHRSKSPIEDFEAQVALAAQSLGLKCGGGSNSERVHKYESVTKIIREALQNHEFPLQNESEKLADQFASELTITEITAREASTNTGIPTVGVEVKAGIPGSQKYEKLLIFEGATPLGTSAGTDEALHLIDNCFEKNSVVEKYPNLFDRQPDMTYKFNKETTEETIASKNDDELASLWHRAGRYRGKGCLNAVDNVNKILSKIFVGKKISEFESIVDVDRMLLKTEWELAVRRHKIAPDADMGRKIAVMQNKANLGMNAILSLSLALARMIGAMKGKNLWEVMRDEMCDIMARVIHANMIPDFFDTLATRTGHNEVLKNNIRNKKALTNTETETIQSGAYKKIHDVKRQILSDTGKTGRILAERLSFSELSLGLQIIDETKPDDRRLYELLRRQTPVYNV